ncbi:uncharacterized protein TRAVEDRAFT_53594 [Trametes versicolor FP-101664 SS1]|uniref:uncharacterized protein n=1 Tax=Trametes versicolor (strain FP-101664) TaxID=717944 RepID=UPI00046226D5|nr:uncharacterized protein TRAVEDRAFT_53594 [Trametes versicolor FP-101664 SS1]EIW52171.1 hypothetical protein TRAVEDRAFT_53594 [Trametes versicolor FP-101664 SS1]
MDTLWLKGLVYGILFFETVQSVIYLDFVYSVYYNVVTHFSDPFNLSASHQWTTRLLAPAAGATIVLCQSFYAYRVYRVGALYLYRLLIAAAIIIMTCTFGFTAASAVAGAELLPGHQLVYYVNAGMIMSVLGLLAFVFAMTHHGSFIYIGFSAVGVKVYANSVLAIINCRQHLSDRGRAGFEMGTQVQDGVAESESAATENHAEHDKLNTTSFE